VTEVYQFSKCWDLQGYLVTVLVAALLPPK